MTLLLPLLLAASAPPPPTLEALYRGARRYDAKVFRFSPPEEGRLQKMQALVGALAGLEGPPGAPLQAQAAALGLEVVQAQDAAGPLWVLREAGSRREGDGLYAFRAQGAPLCLQAPHTFFDEGTGDIALALFASLKASCLFVNTVHRYAPGPGEHPADVAHAPATLFLAATRGLLEHHKWALVQVHGFGPKEALPEGALAVVSDGGRTREKGAPAERVRAALRRLAPAGPVLLYGVDAQVLGATTNVEGRHAREVGAAFVHLEMSKAFREALCQDPAPLASALREGLRLDPP